MLARIHKSMREKDEGFTLIELLVVMVIIGILAAIAIPVFLNQRKKAVDTGVKADVSSAGKEISAYYVDGSATLYGAISSQTLYISTNSTPTSANANGSIKISDANTVGTGASNAVVIGYISGCTNATGWYISLKNSTAGTGTSYYYSGAAGLTTAAPTACT